MAKRYNPTVAKWKESTDLKTGPVASATVIAVGDQLYKDGSGNLLPATSQADHGSLALNQAAFAAAYVGTAQDASASGSTAPISYWSDAIANMFVTTAATFADGDLVGMARTPEAPRSWRAGSSP